MTLDEIRNNVNTMLSEIFNELETTDNIPEYSIDNVPSYFPEKDRERVANMVNSNFEQMELGVTESGMDPILASLYPSPERNRVFQKEFAISEELPITLEGVGPCLGVILQNENTGRSMVVHIEAMADESMAHSEYAKWITLKIKYLFGDEIPPTRIELVSSLGGVFEYHDEVRACLQSLYTDIQIGDYHYEPRVIVDPLKKDISFIPWEDLLSS